MKQLISAISCSMFALGFFALFGQQIAPVWSVEAKTKAAPTCQQKCASKRAECFKNNPRDKRPCVQKYVACVQDCKLASLQRSKTVCLDFEPPRWTVGTQYGVPASQAPGTHIFALNRIRASVHNFVLASGSHTFNLAKVDVAPQPISNGQSLRLNNINVEFDFRQLGFRPAAVEFKFLDLGGLENLAVNGQPVPIYKGELDAAPAALGGVTVAVSTSPVTGGKHGLVTLTGGVKTLRLGGQEFWLDRVCAHSIKPPDQ